MTSTYSAARNISAVNSVIGSIPGMESGMNYEKIETARLLNSSEYTVNTTLGYISLKQTLQSDEVLAVAFDYTINGKTYQSVSFIRYQGDVRLSFRETAKKYFQLSGCCLLGPDDEERLLTECLSGTERKIYIKYYLSE